MAKTDTILQTEKNRDSGLLRKLGVFGLGAAIVNGVIGASIFSLPAAMTGYAGALAPLAFIVCAIAVFAVVICFAEAASRVPTSGGVYGVVDAAFGPLLGLITGVLLWVSAVLACGGIAAAFGDGIIKFFPDLDPKIFRPFAIVAVIIGFSVINIIGVEKAAKFISFATVVKLVPLAIFVVIGGVYVINNPQPVQSTAIATDFGRAIILALFAFSGMETPLGASGEVAEPQKTIPKALFLSMGFILVLYIGVQLVSQGLLGEALSGSKTPLADGIAKAFAPLGILLLLGATLSRMIWIASDILGAPRILFAVARDGRLPKILGELHQKYATPHIAIWFHSILAIALALSGTFEDLAVLSALATAGLYFLSCAAAWKLMHEKVALYGAPLGFKFLPVAAVIGMISMIATLALAQRMEVFAFIGLVLVTILVYYIQKRIQK